MKSTTLLAAVLGSASSVLGHAYISQLVIGDQTYDGFDPFYAPKAGIIMQSWDTSNRNTDGPMRMSDGDGIICGRNPTPAQGVATAQAGSNVIFRWSRWQQNHQGPIITYLADCGGDCKNAVGANLQWFKIDEAGLFQQNFWATDQLIRQGYEWKIQLPTNIKSGQYLMKHEMIALQFATQQNGAQWFTSCVNVNIQGGTAQQNPQAVKLQDYYTNQAQSLYANIQGLQSYNIPGPQIPQGLGNTPSPQINDGQNKNPAFPREFPNEPTDDNGTRANVHLDYNGGGSSSQQTTQGGNSNANNYSYYTQIGSDGRRYYLASDGRYYPYKAKRDSEQKAKRRSHIARMHKAKI